MDAMEQQRRPRRSFPDHRQTFPTRAAARRAIFEFIEVFYNRGRLHSTLNYRTPAEYEEERRKPSKAQAA